MKIPNQSAFSNSFPDSDNPKHLYGLASPIELSTSTTTVYLEDYFPNPSIITKVEADEELQLVHHPKKNTLLLTPKNGFPPLGIITIWIDKITYAILVKRTRKTSHILYFDPNRTYYDSVSLAGEMNNWSVEAGTMFFRKGKWQISFELNPGRYAYQLVVDGTWMLDPENPEKKANNLGGYNSVLSIGEDVSEQTPKMYTLSFDNTTLNLGYEKELTHLIVFWENHELVDYSINTEEQSIRILIPKAAKNYERSHIRIYAYNQAGVSNDLKIPLEYGKVVQNAAQLTRSDKAAQLIYFLLVDRFYNGDRSLDDPVKDDRLHEKANFHGGDLVGILQKLEEGYFKALHVNTLWLSPLYQNPLAAFQEWPEPKRFFSGYHGYWPISSKKIDHRFGDSNRLQELIKVLHEQNINILLDFVSNHVHQEHPFYQEYPEWFTSMHLPDGSPNMRLWNEQRFTTWFDDFLPTLDYEQPEVVTAMTKIALHWLNTYDIDGFRHDATKHIPEHFWRSLCLQVKKEVLLPENRSIYQVGESFGSRELIGHYVSSGKMDGQFDFNLYFDARQTFASADSSFKPLHASLMESLDYYGHQHLMCNISGNHDMPRFISYATGQLRFDEGEQNGNWEYDWEMKPEHLIGYQRLQALLTFIMTIPGIPVIYYGDEIGMFGGHDPDNRLPMRFENLSEAEQQTKTITAKLAQIRQSQLALIYGDFQLLHLSDNCYVFLRSYFDNVVIVAFNKSDKAARLFLDLPTRFRELRWKAVFGDQVFEHGKDLTLRRTEVFLVEK